MKQEISDKDFDIEQNRMCLEIMKSQIKQKDDEIIEKDTIIQRLQAELNYSTDKSDDEEGTDKDDVDVGTNTNDNSGLTIGSGQFGKVLEVRPGMEDEAILLRKEWKHKQKQK